MPSKNRWEQSGYCDLPIYQIGFKEYTYIYKVFDDVCNVAEYVALFEQSYKHAQKSWVASQILNGLNQNNR